MSNQFKLMKEKRFRPFFLTQFWGAFNDNMFKTALITLVAFHAATLTTLDSGMLVTVLPGVFILPFFLFSATAGQLADKFEKSFIIRLVKIFEIGIMLFASTGFLLHNIWLLGVALFMMGMHSTLFGPIKYAYLPQHLGEKEIVGGNGMIEMGTFVAILMGQVLGAWIVIQRDHEIITSVAVLLIAALGYWHSRGVPDSPASEPLLEITGTRSPRPTAASSSYGIIRQCGSPSLRFHGSGSMAQPCLHNFPTLQKTYCMAMKAYSSCCCLHSRWA